MSKQIHYSDEPLGDIKLISDFLPLPEELNAPVMSLNYYNSLVETRYLLSSSANVAHLNRSIAQYKASQLAQQNPVDK